MFSIFRKRPAQPLDTGTLLEEEFPRGETAEHFEGDGAEYPLYSNDEIGETSEAQGSSQEGEPDAQAPPNELHEDTFPVVSLDAAPVFEPEAALHANGVAEESSALEAGENAVEPIEAAEDETDAAVSARRSLFKRGERKQRKERPRRSSSKPLPLGIEISEAGIGIVYALLGHGEFYIEDARWIDLPAALDEANRDRVISTLRETLSQMGIRERRCVLSISALDVTSSNLTVPDKARTSEISGMAEIASNKLVTYPAAERAIALEPLGKTEVLLSIARKSIIDYTAALARDAGLKPIAIDSSRNAWQRVVDADALLDLRGQRPILSVFSQHVDEHFEPGSTYSLSPDAQDDEIAMKIGNAFLEMRRDKGFAITRIAVAADPQRFDSIESALESIGGLHVSPVTIAGRSDCSFALALGLARWSLADYGVPGMLRTNLLADRADTIKIARLRIPELAIRESLVALAAVAAVIVAVVVIQAYRYKAVSDEVATTIQQDMQLAPQVKQAHQLAVTITALKSMIEQVQDIRSSGNALAVGVARIGTQVSGNHGTWITSLNYDAQTGWDVQGGSSSLSMLGTTANSVNRTNTFTLLTTSADPQKGITYHAQIREPGTVPVGASAPPAPQPAATPGGQP